MRWDASLPVLDKERTATHYYLRERKPAEGFCKPTRIFGVASM